MSEVSGLSLNECLGSVESVIGMPSGVSSAIRCRALCQAANSRPPGAAPSRLKWLILRLRTIDEIEGRPKVGLPSSSSAKAAMVWNSIPTLSASSIRPSRSSTRSSIGRVASR